MGLVRNIHLFERILHLFFSAIQDIYQCFEHAYKTRSLNKSGQYTLNAAPE